MLPEGKEQEEQTQDEARQVSLAQITRICSVIISAVG